MIIDLHKNIIMCIETPVIINFNKPTQPCAGVCIMMLKFTIFAVTDRHSQCVYRMLVKVFLFVKDLLNLPLIRQVCLLTFSPTD
jgi:hypothetical protein